MTGKRWARTGNVSASRRARAAETDPVKAARVEPVTPRGATGSQIHYAVKSHLAAARHLVAGCGDACAAMWLGDTARHGTLWGGTAKEAERSPASDVPCRARSDALRRVPSSPLPEISARNKSSMLLVIDVESGTGHGRLRASSFALLRDDHLNVADGVAGNSVCVEDEVPAVLGQVEVVVRSDITLQGVLADFHDDGIL